MFFFAESLWCSQIMTSGSQFFSWSFSLVLFDSPVLGEIICLVVSGCKHAFKAFERLQHAKDTTMTSVSGIIPNVCVHFRACPRDPNQSKTKYKLLLEESHIELLKASEARKPSQGFIIRFLPAITMAGLGEFFLSQGPPNIFRFLGLSGDDLPY